MSRFKSEMNIGDSIVLFMIAKALVHLGPFVFLLSALCRSYVNRYINVNA